MAMKPLSISQSAGTAKGKIIALLAKFSFNTGLIDCGITGSEGDGFDTPFGMIKAVNYGFR